MNFLRKSALVIIVPIFILLLYATAFDTGVVRVVGQPTGVKQVIADSGVYSTAVSSLLDQAKQQTSDSGSIDLTNQIIKSAANSTFSAQYIQTQTEKVIDSVFVWLNGQTPQPDFKIDLSSLKQQFAAAAGQAAQQQATTLPVCADAASSQAALDNPLAATCLPHGVTPQAVAAKVEDNITQGKGFLNDTVITAASVKNNGSNQSVFADQLKDAPKQYQRVKKTPFILSIVSLLLAVAIVFLSSSRRKGLRRAGILLLCVGIFMLFFAWGLNQAIAKEVPKIKINNLVLQADIHKLATELGQKIDQNYWIFGGIYAVLGALAIIVSMVLGKRGGGHPEQVSAPAPHTHIPQEDKVIHQEPAPKPKKAPRTIKIQ